MKNLKELRKKRNLSQLRLAMELGLSQQTIHKYESGKAEPDIHTLIQLARFFHVSVDYLIGNEEISDAGTSVSAKNKKKRNPELVVHLSPSEFHFISLYQNLSPQIQSSVNLILEEMLHT